jgi:hypothetical protein
MGAIFSLLRRGNAESDNDADEPEYEGAPLTTLLKSRDDASSMQG